VAFQWADYDRAFIRRRYDRISSLIVFFEWLFFLPAGFRREAAAWLGLKRGDSVLEIGCGTGRNLPYLREAVGAGGQVYGVDLSAGMLARAHDLTEANNWANVSLVQADAAEYVAPRPLDAILFGLSYNTMPHHLTVLRHALTQLRPGGRLVIMDAKVPPGLGGRLILPLSVWLMKLTVLGNPHIRPWDHLAPLTEDFVMQEFLLGSYYICRGTKSSSPSSGHASDESSDRTPRS
jgi:demethylmenaquinone methyltransferase/2-methoxy-6-polyprenyl-1,4-benzoquinol methylase